MVAKNQESGVEVKSRKISLNMEEIKKAPKEDPKEVEAAAAADALVKTEEVAAAPKKKKKKARITYLYGWKTFELSNASNGVILGIGGEEEEKGGRGP